MANKSSDSHEFLGERLQELQTWLERSLEHHELRDAETVRKAKAEFLKWACYGWDHGGGDVDGALANALESYIEHGPIWADKDEAFHAALPLSAEPAWELPEFHLLVASALADHALTAFEKGTKSQLALAAMLYADAVEVRWWWQQMRGHAKARNKETSLGKVFRMVEESFQQRRIDVARKETARKGAMAKLANDPVQVAKAEAYKLWQERHTGSHPNLRTNEQFATECMKRWPALTSARVITGWCTEWNKAARKTQSAS